MPPRTRNPSSAHGSPLSPPGEGSRPGQTSPLASAQRFRRPPPEDPVAAKFVHDKTPDRPLILGYHYTLLDLSPSDLVSESMEEDVVEGAKCKIQISSYVFW
ncbi:uncharacterized protein MELLADRAFT_114420 [Melampsora larici-populina 98AG31]|uniref:Uncharacterized protein n=1 Tax=Melampsora larici-populina (strain 98AG31 / pathotype 3-4-7) TaxID=747676 RepID=F4SDE0_MELLP|nr:uncharacterized protein MELLADRAFT_114420 [Melampsora larici-populina 98AG31]EGF97336.1 hypothetical protein MELLADRAFT_114420 [Melampsora larici-populina 98AG31]